MAKAQNPGHGLMRKEIYDPGGKAGQVALAEELNWKIVGTATGTSAVSVANVIGSASEFQITAYVVFNSVEVVYSQVISAASMSESTARLCLGGYYAESNDYGSCWCNVSRSEISLRHLIYAAKSYSGTDVGIRVRYR